MEPESRLRVALIAGTLGQGGAEKQLVYMARALGEAGADVAAFSLTRGEHHEAAFASLGIPLTAADGSRASRVAALVRGLRKFRPHVAQSGHTFANTYAALAGAASGALTLGALRSSLAHSRRGNGALTRLHMAAPQAVVVNSLAAFGELSSAGMARGVYHVPNAIEAERPGSFAGASRGGRVATVAFVARLVPEKRLDLFLEALALARNGGAPLRGIVVGDGPTRASGEASALALGLLDGSACAPGVAPNGPSRGVEFLGRRDDVPRILETADMLLLCSEEEGFPNVLLEAMVAGLPVVTTPAGDAAAIVKNEETGFVVSGGGAERLAECLSTLALTPELRARFGERGRRRALEEYGLGKLATRLLEVYRDLAARRGHRRALHALA